MNLDFIQDIVKIAAVALPAIITATGYIAANSKNKKLKQAAENLNKVSKAAQIYVADAEQFLNYSGTEKKQWVLTKINQYAIENKIPYDAETVANVVEEIVTLSKKVNSREKDKEVLE
jgi:ABC-type uncharacterized transport system fused permease/ATPase subunit